MMQLLQHWWGELVLWRYCPIIRRHWISSREPASQRSSWSRSCARLKYDFADFSRSSGLMVRKLASQCKYSVQRTHSNTFIQSRRQSSPDWLICLWEYLGIQEGVQRMNLSPINRHKTVRYSSGWQNVFHVLLEVFAARVRGRRLKKSDFDSSRERWRPDRWQILSVS
jgi:hypothetical protein